MKKQVLRFILIGSLTVLIDYLFYRLIISVNVAYSYAKATSFIVGATFAYFANKRFTFELKTFSYSQIVKFAMLYISTLSVNIFINKITILLGTHIIQKFYLENLISDKMIVNLAFLSATGSSTILNFLGQKFWVFDN